MIIKIKKCSNPQFWYNNKIGQEYLVDEEWKNVGIAVKQKFVETHYAVRSGDNIVNLVMKEDVE